MTDLEVYKKYKEASDEWTIVKSRMIMEGLPGDGFKFSIKKKAVWSNSESDVIATLKGLGLKRGSYTEFKLLEPKKVVKNIGVENISKINGLFKEKESLSIILSK